MLGSKKKKLLSFLKTASLYYLLFIYQEILEFSFACCLLDSYCYCYSHTNHRVVTSANKSHHFNVCRYRTGARVPGATVILEDVAAPVGDLDRLVDGVQALFRKYDYDGAIFGHARDGNIHPMLTSTIEGEKETLRFRNFMDGLVDHVISLEGSLKGEHGTGREIGRAHV